MSKVITFGEMLLRLSTSGQKLLEQSDRLELHFGGSEVNVAVALAKMGISVGLVSALPDHALAAYARQQIGMHGVATNQVQTGPGRLGLYFLEQGASIRGSRVVYDREFSAYSLLKKGDIDWKSIFKNARWFHLSGISAAVSQSAAEVCLEAVEAAASAGLTVSMDLNYRKNLWKYGLAPAQVMPALVAKSHVLLGDPATANLMLGTSVPAKEHYHHPDDLLEAYTALHGTFPNLTHIGMTLREVISANHHRIGGAVFHQGKMTGSQPIAIAPVVERIGGGDAFMAGLIHGLLHKKDLSFTVDFATVASALKMTIPGDFNLFNPQEIEAAMQSGFTGKISR